ncbi:MAG: hypothetical protein R3E53_20960 [Myxococcota bacterium]
MTQPFHLTRALYLAEARGLGALGLPAGGPGPGPRLRLREGWRAGGRGSTSCGRREREDAERAATWRHRFRDDSTGGGDVRLWHAPWQPQARPIDAASQQETGA